MTLNYVKACKLSKHEFHMGAAILDLSTKHDHGKKKLKLLHYDKCKMNENCGYTYRKCLGLLLTESCDATPNNHREISTKQSRKCPTKLDLQEAGESTRLLGPTKI